MDRYDIQDIGEAIVFEWLCVVLFITSPIWIVPYVICRWYKEVQDGTD